MYTNHPQFTGDTSLLQERVCVGTPIAGKIYIHIDEYASPHPGWQMLAYRQEYGRYWCRVGRGPSMQMDCVPFEKLVLANK